MISQRVRTHIRGSSGDLIFFAAVFAVVFIVFFTLALEPASDDPDDPIDVLRTIFMLSAFFASVCTGIRMFVRQTREKRIRLFSQLPVSNLQVSVASWYFRFLCLSIPTGAWMLFLILEDNSIAHYLQVVRATIAFFLAVVTLVAAISVKMSLFNLPISRFRKFLYLYLAVFAVLLSIAWMQPGVFDEVVQAFTGHGNMLPVNLFLLLSSTALVSLDIWLRNRSDNYLG